MVSTVVRANSVERLGRYTCPRHFPFDRGQIGVFAGKGVVEWSMRTSPILRDPRVKAIRNYLDGTVRETLNKIAHINVGLDSNVGFNYTLRTKPLPNLVEFQIYPSEKRGCVIVALRFIFTNPTIKIDPEIQNTKALDESLEVLMKNLRRQFRSSLVTSVRPNNEHFDCTHHENDKLNIRFIEIQIH